MKALSKREEEILLLLKRFDFLTRDQINAYFKLGTIRNTNYVLNKLSNYLQSIREGYQSIYYLSKEGREYVDCDKIRKKGGHIYHIIIRNQFWLHSKCPKDWKNEVKISSGELSVVSDAVFTLNGFFNFLEVDRVQKMSENRIKIKKYKEIMDDLVKQFGYFPTLVWVTKSDYRKKQLEEACAGLKTKIYLIEDIM